MTLHPKISKGGKYSMKKKLLSALLSTAMVASLLVGCGGSDNNASDSTADNSARSEERRVGKECG